MDDYSDTIAAAAVGIVALVILVFVWVALIGLFVGGSVLYSLLSAPGARRWVLPPAPPRWFNAPPMSRWVAAYDCWLFRLEDLTGANFTKSPGRIMAGTVLLTLVPALLLGLLLTLLDPRSGGQWLVLLGVGGIVVGAATGWYYARPAPGWFGSGRARREDRQGLPLGRREDDD